MDNLYGFERVDDWHYVWYVDDDELVDVYIIGDVYILRHECDFNSESFKFTYDEMLKYVDSTFSYMLEDDDDELCELLSKQRPQI